MMDFLFSNGAAWFAVPAILGTFVFVLRLVLTTVGVAGVDLDLGHGDIGHGDPGEAFKIVSFQAIAAFAMGFGWAGLGGYRGMGWSMPLSLVIGLGGGVGMAWMLGTAMRSMHKLQSSGNIEIADAAGCEGDVYLGVPAPGGGRGQVRVSVSGRQRIYNAVSEGEALATGTRVRVVRVNGDHTLTVARAV